MEPYWREDRDAPFATLLRIIDIHCHAEADPDAYDDLITLARHPDHTDEQTRSDMAQFKNELRQALLGDRPPPGALSTAATYDEANDEEFLARLWADLYPGEAPPHH